MADQTVGELIRAQDIGPTDLFVLEQSGVAKSLTGQILINWMTRYADGHGGIQKIEKTKTQGLVDTYRITMADTTTFDFPVTNGRSITSITKTGTSGLTDTYTIAYNSGAPTTFAVTNGAKGDKGDNVYLWIKYASQKPSEGSHSMGDVPDNWIGVYAGTKSSAPSEWSEYEWFQWKGNQGDPGTPATLVSSKTEYQLSGNGTAPPSGSWSVSVPVVPQGSFLWTRTTQQYNTGSPVVSYSVSRFGIDGKGSVSSVCQKSPTPDGNVEIGATDVDALPITGGSMHGEINMQSYSLTGLGDASRDGDAVSLKYAREHYAPAGYGYGGEIPNLITASSDQELNTKLDGLLAGMPNFSARNVRITHNGNQIVNGVFGMGGQGTLYGTLYKHSNDYAILSVYSYLGSQFSMTKNSKWGEVEWVNPVVKMGGEYRTTEKYNGKPIYTSMIDGGKCPASTTRTVRHNFKIDQIIKQSGWINYFGVVLPYFDPDRPEDKLVAETTANKTVVSIKTNTDAWTAYNWFVQIWYTKE